MKTLLLAGLLLTGCQAPQVPAPLGPDADTLELAFQVAWDDVLGMRDYPRPSIIWWSNCDVPADADFADPHGVCYADTIRPDGIDARWFGAFTAPKSGFAIDLWWMKGWVLYGDSIIEEHKEPDGGSKVLTALKAAGL